MSVELYTGTPGSGKSLHAVSLVRQYLNAGKLVIANFEIPETAPCDLTGFVYVPNNLLTPELVVRLIDLWLSGGRPAKEGAALLVVDECSIIFNSRSWQSKARMPWLEFMSQSRKHLCRVLLIAQGAKMIDNQFRMLCDIEVQHYAVSSFGNMGWLLSLPFGGRLFWCVEMQFQAKERLGAYLFRGSRKDCAMYDTHALFVRVEG